MANNIYIGMRYVPIYVGDYDSETVYEPLSIVAYNGASYTSKQTVPAGILPTNTTYWAKSSDFNAQYSELDGRITDNAEAIEAIDDKVDENYQGYLDGKTIAILGDSSAKLFDTFNHFASYTNATIVNVSTNGAKWGDVVTQVNGLSVTPDYILVICGSNDITGSVGNWLGHTLGAPDIDVHTYSNDGTTFDNIKKFCNVARDRYPRCEIIGLLRADHPNIASDKWKYFKYFETAILSEFGVPCIDLQAILNLAYFNSAQAAWALQQDGLHYTDPMMDRMTRHIVDIMKNAWTYNIVAVKPNIYFADYQLPAYNPAGWAGACAWVAKHCYHKGNTNTGRFNEVCVVRCKQVGDESLGEAFFRSQIQATNSNARITIYENNREWYVVYDLTNNTVVSVNEHIDRWQTPSDNNISNLASGLVQITTASYGDYTNMPPTTGGYLIWVSRFYTNNADGFGTYIAIRTGSPHAYIGYDTGKGTEIKWREITATTPA